MELKRGALFSTDALIALLIIFLSITVVYPTLKYSVQRTNIHGDLIVSLSSLKIGEVNSSYVKTLIASGEINNLNNSVLEQIGEFYAVDSPYAKGLAEEVLNMIESKRNVGIWYGDYLLASINSTPFEEAENVDVERQVIGGIEKGTDIHGYSARAFLSKSAAEEYFYFGGYVGDGDISVNMDYEGNIRDVNLEVAINKEFDIYINGIFSGHYDKSPSELVPAKYPLSSYLGNFQSGSNTIEFRGDNLYIAGGFLKISYLGSLAYQQPTRYYFPGIEGVVNLYDGFYVPGKLNSLEIFLHLDTAYEAFLTIGNVTVFRGFTTGEETITLTNAELSALLDYDSLEQKTTPLRLGLYELQSGLGGNADVVLITDLSGSMDFRLDSDNIGQERDCDDPNLYDSDTKRISLARCLDKTVVDTILSVPGNRVALSAFYGDESNPYKGHVYEESLTDDGSYLKSKIEAYSPQGGTPICAAINDAYKILNEESNSSRNKFVIVMSDGIPTHTCAAANKCDGTRTGLPSEEALWLGFGAGCYGGLDDCEVNDCLCASQNAEWSSCRVYDDLGATVYSIGFGPVAGCSMASNTLRDISECGGGNYYSSDNATLLEQFYVNITKEIIDISYTEQVSQIIGNISTRLYPDSYIEFGYDSEEVPYGLVVIVEAEGFDDVSQGIVNIPENASVLEAFAISYSGSRWTSVVDVNNNVIYNLSAYGSTFVELGDPYSISIPPILLNEGDNLVKIRTAESPQEFGLGSSSDKVVYTIVKEFISYSKISASVNGCVWNISLDNGQYITARVPMNYSGSNECFFQMGNIVYNENDAIDYAVYDLLRNLDFDSDGDVDVIFGEGDLEIDSSQIDGIPFTWATEVQIRIWD